MQTGRSALVALLIVVIPACSSGGDASDRVGTTRLAFDSAASELTVFDIDGKLVSDTAEPAALRALVQAQLLYSVGALNMDRSLGRFERLELSAIRATPRGTSGTFDVSYRALLPVAWGSPPRPATYTLVLPARASASDQERFTAKYNTSCVDPTVGDVGVGQMFLHYQPRRPGCVLDANDVVQLQATVSPSPENTSGKYPEYHRVWEDGALDVVAVFSRQVYDPAPAGATDYGVQAYDAFLASLDDYLRARQPDATQRTTATDLRSATLPDGRVIRVHAALVGAQLEKEGPAFDAWYDAHTPTADVLLYSGHADLGQNVRTLMTKGTFVRGKYALWVVNGCDTFAYVDGTLAARRALLNPDDPSGTKYMDTVTTVMGGYFSTGPATAMTFVDAMVTARDAVPAPKTFRAMFAGIDPQQVTVVTGEEDNVFDPSMFAPKASAPSVGDPAPDMSPPPTAVRPAKSASCAAAPPRRGHGVLAAVVALAAALITRRSRRA